jgi:hypothetical protein
MSVRMQGKKEPSNTAGGNVSKYNHYGKQYGGFSKNWKWICYTIQQYYS